MPGLFGNCLNGFFHPFTDVIEELKQSGFTVHDFQTAGRAGSVANAQRMANQFAENSRILPAAHAKVLWNGTRYRHHGGQSEGLPEL